MKLAPGFYESMPFAEYNEIEATRFSDLKYMERSPLAYRYHKDNPTPPTSPMILGNAAHLAILEPDMANFAVWPGPGRRFGREWDTWCADNEGKTLLNVKERDYVVGMTLAVHANPDARKYLPTHSRRELTMVWRDLAFKRDMKARIDLEMTDREGNVILVGLKSTVDCRDFRFGAQAAKMCYHAQDAIYQSAYFYLTGTLPRMVTIAVESKPPHEIAVYSIPTEVLRQGQQLAAKWIDTLAACERTNKWPPAVEGEQELVLPAWAYPGGDFEFDDLMPIER